MYTFQSLLWKKQIHIKEPGQCRIKDKLDLFYQGVK